jgi:type IV pilus assembly protein PilP
MMLLLLVATLIAQPPAQAMPSAAPAVAVTPPVDPDYAYSSEGRRDPFVSLIRSGSDSRAVRRDGAEGIGALSVDEISVRGIVAGTRGLIAMVQGPDNKTYLVRQNDKLLDGSVKTITRQGMVILQEVSDPLSLVKQKEVRKLLRGTEEGK